MPDNARKAAALGGLAIAGLLAAAILARPTLMQAGPEAVSSDHGSQGKVTEMPEHDRHSSSASAQASSLATGSASASASAQASASARSSASTASGRNETDCAADAMASAQADGERVTVRDSRRHQDARDGCRAEAQAVAGEKRNDAN